MKSTIRVLVSLTAAVITYFAALLASYSLIPSGAGLWRPLIVLTFVALVTWYVWRHSASPPQLLVSAGMLGVLVAAVLGWGYWGGLSHGDLQVSILDIALKNDQQFYGRVLTGEVTFRNATGGTLAHGSADSRMIHPEVGDCRREEGEGQTAWQACFDAQSQWFVTWVPQVHHATVRLDTCTIDEVPVRVEKSRERWWLRWVPHPHLDNSTRTHFELILWIDSASCSPADRSRVGSALILDVPDFCASRSCLTLATGIAVEAAALNAIEDSPPGHRAAGTIEERTRHVHAPMLTAAWATPPGQSPR